MQIETATLKRLYDPDKAMAALTRRCHQLRNLIIFDGGSISRPRIEMLAAATRLSSLRLGADVPIGLHAITQVMVMCPSLIELKCYSVLVDNPLLDDVLVRPTKLQVLKLVYADNAAPWAPLYLHKLTYYLPHLRELVLEGWRVWDPLGLETLKGLLTLDLRRSMYWGDFLSQQLPPSLERFYLQGQSVDVKPGAHLPHLRELACGSIEDLATILNDPKDDGSEPLSLLYSLEVEMSAVSDERELLSTLAHHRLRELRKLKLGGHQVKDEDVAPAIAAMANLRVMDLSDTSVTGVTVKAAVRGLQLESLILAGCAHVGMDAVEWARNQGIKVVWSPPYVGAPGKGKKVRYDLMF